MRSRGVSDGEHPCHRKVYCVFELSTLPKVQVMLLTIFGCRAGAEPAQGQVDTKPPSDLSDVPRAWSWGAREALLTSIFVFKGRLVQPRLGKAGRTQRTTLTLTTTLARRGLKTMKSEANQTEPQDSFTGLLRSCLGVTQEEIHAALCPAQGQQLRPGEPFRAALTPELPS